MEPAEFGLFLVPQRRMCKEHTTKLKVNSAVRTLGRTEVGISATPEHVSCTPCRQFASTGGLFSAVRAVLDGRVAARDAVIEATLRDRGWTSLRGRGRRTAALRAELAWSKRTRALPPMLPHRREFPVSGVGLRKLIGYTLWWLEHLRRQPHGGTAPHVAHIGIPDWMRAMEREARLALAASAERWSMLQAAVARALVADTLGLKPRSVRRALPDRARLRRDFEAVWDQIIDSFLARCNSSSPAERPGIVEQSPFEECDAGDAALLGIRGPDGAAAYFRPRATAVRARLKFLARRGLGGWPDLGLQIVNRTRLRHNLKEARYVQCYTEGPDAGAAASAGAPHGPDLRRPVPRT